MPGFCEICGKEAIKGHQIIRRGAAKRRGGAGRKITGKSIRRQLPNLQTVKVVIGGTPRRITVCTSCLKAGKVQKLQNSARA